MSIAKTILNRRAQSQAFPVPAGNFSGGESWSPEEGMSLRDWFAGQALSACVRGCMNPEEAAEHAYRVADAMVAQGLKVEALS
jgi:hypothetical protein